MAKKRKVMKALPVELVEDILSRLPIKSLVRFKAVCKSWQAIISDPKFSEIWRIQRSKSDKQLFLVKRQRLHMPCGSYALVEFENRRFRDQSELGNPIGDWNPLCSCNGLVLLKDPTYNNVYTLWNPSIRQYARIWHEDFGFHDDCNYGLYHDSTTNDYKIVVICREHYAVYSCKDGIWAETKPTPPSFNSVNNTFFDGSFYWWDWEGREVMCFDVTDDKFKTLEMKAHCYGKFIVLSGSLCLYYYNGFNVTKTKLRLWVMEKHSNHNYCWRNLVDIEMEKPHQRIYGPVCLTNQDDVVLRVRNPKGRGLGYVVFNYREKRLEESWGYPGLYYNDLLLYSESLVFPIRKNN